MRDMAPDMNGPVDHPGWALIAHAEFYAWGAGVTGWATTDRLYTSSWNDVSGTGLTNRYMSTSVYYCY